HCRRRQKRRNRTRHPDPRHPKRPGRRHRRTLQSPGRKIALRQQVEAPFCLERSEPLPAPVAQASACVLGFQSNDSAQMNLRVPHPWFLRVSSYVLTALHFFSASGVYPDPVGALLRDLSLGSLLFPFSIFAFAHPTSHESRITSHLPLLFFPRAASSHRRFHFDTLAFARASSRATPTRSPLPLPPGRPHHSSPSPHRQSLRFQPRRIRIPRGRPPPRLGLCLVPSAHPFSCASLPRPFRHFARGLPLLFLFAASRWRLPHWLHGQRNGRPPVRATRFRIRGHPLRPGHRRAHAIHLVRLLLLGPHRFPCSQTPPDQQPALLPAHRRLHRPRLAQQVHHPPFFPRPPCP